MSPSAHVLRKGHACSMCSTSNTHWRSHTGQGMLRLPRVAQAPSGSSMVASCLLPTCGTLTPELPLESALGVSG